jgi:hypothetical protein
MAMIMHRLLQPLCNLLLSMEDLAQYLSLSSNKSLCGYQRWRRRKSTITIASNTPRVVLCVIHIRKVEVSLDIYSKLA